jgi:NADPH:quinone reductase-like Zn-dependent oxidoreductase
LERDSPAEEADIHPGFFAGLKNGTLRPAVGKELQLAEAARAYKEMSLERPARSVLIC